MSAELDLIPKLPVLVVQTGIFLANVGLIRNLFVLPYLKVRDDRERTTIGKKDDAIRLSAEFKELSEDIDRRLGDSMRKIRQEREFRRTKALERRQEIIQSAITESKSIADDAEKMLKEAVRLEKSKIPDVVREISEAVFRTTLGIK